MDSSGSSNFNPLNYYQKLSQALAQKQNKVKLKTITNGCVVTKKLPPPITRDDIIKKTLFAKYGNARNSEKEEEPLIENTRPKVNEKIPTQRKIAIADNIFELKKPNPERKLAANEVFKEPPKKFKTKQENYLNLPNEFFDSFKGPNVTLFNKEKIAEKPKSIEYDKAEETTLGSVRSFKPHFTSTPLEKVGVIPMIADPEEINSIINKSREKERQDYRLYCRKVMKMASNIAQKILDEKLNDNEDPIETERAHIRHILNIPEDSADSENTVVPEYDIENVSVKSNDFWIGNNKTIPSTPLNIIPLQASQKALDTPEIVLPPTLKNHETISKTKFDQDSPHDETMNLFNYCCTDSPFDLPCDNDFPQVDFDLLFKDSPIFSEPKNDSHSLNFLTPINQVEKPKMCLQRKKKFVYDSPDSLFGENDDSMNFNYSIAMETNFTLDGRELDSNLEEDPDQFDYSFAEFRSPPAVEKEPTQSSRHHSVAETSLSSYKWQPYINREFSTYNPNATISEFNSPDPVFAVRDIFKNSFN